MDDCKILKRSHCIGTMIQKPVNPCKKKKNKNEALYMDNFGRY